MNSPIKTRHVAVWRGEGEIGHFETYDVPAYDNQTVLDVVSHIQHYIDPSLSYRFACRVGMCGSCAMMVNGEPRWTCRTHVNKVAGQDVLEIAPLRNLPVIKDLATNMDPFFEKWVKAEAVHHSSSSRDDDMTAVLPDDAERKKADAGIECINCAVCYAACDTVAGNVDYLGPAALQRAWTLYNDARDAGKQTILEAVSGAGGCHNCHAQGGCSHYCPSEVNPMQAIAGLKQAATRALLKGKL